jgi:hypothetical protein
MNIEDSEDKFNMFCRCGRLEAVLFQSDSDMESEDYEEELSSDV